MDALISPSRLFGSPQLSTRRRRVLGRDPAHGAVNQAPASASCGHGSSSQSSAHQHHEGHGKCDGSHAHDHAHDAKGAHAHGHSQHDHASHGECDGTHAHDHSHAHSNGAHDHGNAQSHDHDLEHSNHAHDHDHGHAHRNGAHHHGHGAHDHGHHSHGHGAHSHVQADASWGPARRAVYDTLGRLGVLGAADAWGSNVRAAGAALVLLLSCTLAARVADASWLASLCCNALLGATYVLSGVPAFVEALLQVMSGKVDTHVLMFCAAMGTVVLRMPLEGAALLVLFHVSHALEHHYAHAARASLTSLVDAMPQQATVLGALPDGSPDWAAQLSVAAASVAAGSLVAVKPGEMVPLDGTITSGQALVGRESLTGEALPVPRRCGDDIEAGSLVYDGTLVIRTTQTAATSAPARIAEITAEAARNRPRLESFLSSIASRWSTAVMLVAAASLAAMLVAGLPAWGASGAVYRCLGLLTAAAPCALVVTPLAYVCAMAVLTRYGVLVRGAHIIDVVRKVASVALDKTGTVSRGRLQCVAVRACALPPAGASAGAGAPSAAADGAGGNGDGERAALDVAAAMSLRSQHPVCGAVLEHHHRLREEGGRATAHALPELAGFGLVSGAGMWAERADGTGVLFGSAEYVSCALTDRQRIELHAAVEGAGSGRIVSVVLEGAGVVDAARAMNAGNSADAARVGPVRATIFVFADAPEADSKQAVAWIRRHGRQLLVLTGDNLTSAETMAREVDIKPTELRGNLTPQQKADAVVAEQQAGRVVLMCGDGINDAPALAAADVGVAVAESTAGAAAAAASVVILRSGSGQPSDSFRGAVGAVAMLIHVAWVTRRVVVQNLFIALASIVLAAVPAVQGLTPLWVTVLVHEGSTVLVALNCMRILALRHPLRLQQAS